MRPVFKRILGFAGVLVAIMGCLIVGYVRAHPLVFNESFWQHAHCIKCAGLSFRIYATEHAERFPFHTNGFGDALLLMSNEVGGFWACLTGPGYDAKPFKEAFATGSHLPEEKCGRVYVQGLSDTNNSEIALLFDKLPTPGGDHCSGFARLTAPLMWEVCLVDGTMKIILEAHWPEFSRRQIELLVEAGIARHEAERLYGGNRK